MNKYTLQCAVLLLAGSCFSIRAMDPDVQAGRVARIFVKEFLASGCGSASFNSGPTSAAFAKKDYRLAFRVLVKEALGSSSVSGSFSRGKVKNANFPLLVKTFVSEYINTGSGSASFSSAKISGELARL